MTWKASKQLIPKTWLYVPENHVRFIHCYVARGNCTYCNCKRIDVIYIKFISSSNMIPHYLTLVLCFIFGLDGWALGLHRMSGYCAINSEQHAGTMAHILLLLVSTGRPEGDKWEHPQEWGENRRTAAIQEAWRHTHILCNTGEE